MSNIVVPVYPSQLDSFKGKADILAEQIKQHLDIKVSKFKRYEFLSRAIGYKGHDRLIDNAKNISQADKNKPLYLFSDTIIKLQIIDAYQEHLGDDSSQVMQQICNQLGDAEHSTGTKKIEYQNDTEFFVELKTCIEGKANEAKDMNPYRKLIILGINELLRQKKISLEYSTSNNRNEGHLETVLAGEKSIILWSDEGSEELRVNVWWKYEHNKNPSANLTGNRREDFSCDMPLPNIKKYKQFVGVTCGAWLERREGLYLQGEGGRGIFSQYTRKGELTHLKNIPNPIPNGFAPEGKFFM